MRISKYIIEDDKLMSQWNYEKNKNLNPEYITLKAGQEVWWKCEKGHEWKISPALKKGCPYCNNRKVLTGYNDLATLHPKLAKEFHPSKNGNLNPSYIVGTSGRIKYWWKCEKGHEYLSDINSRVGRKSGCPYCSNKKILAGYNDLATTNPELIKEWNYEKNKNLNPKNLFAGSARKVWWKCEKGHEWEATLNSRKNGVGCPICSAEKSTSFPEQAILYYCSKIFKNVYNRYKFDGKNEIDIFIADYNIGIEYDGVFFHSSEYAMKREQIKNAEAKKHNITLIRVKETKHYQKSSNSIIYYIPNNEKSKTNLNEAIEKLFIRMEEIIGQKIIISIDVNKDNIRILEQYMNLEKENSLLYKMPDYAKEWNYEKNGSLTPDKINYASNKRVWWKCEKGHEWKISPSAKSGCPYCSGRYAIEGETDLATTNPELIKEWNYEKNKDIKLSTIMRGSHLKVWWKCEKGHEWEASVYVRNAGYGCPYCSGRYAIEGETDLATTNPKLAKEWNYEKNKDIIPQEVSSSSEKKVWWKCEKGHEYQAQINNRLNGTGCPYCSGRYAIEGETDLATLQPELIKEWNYEKNKDITPTSITSHSGQKVWWKCEKGHEWEAVVYSRANGTGCPICSNNQILKGYNDLATLQPELLKEWNYEKNKDITPQEVGIASNKRVWWKCEKGHEWEAVIYNKSKGGRCPYCNNRLVLKGYNDLATTNPELLNEWDYEKNDKSPNEIVSGTGYKAYWTCSNNHKYQMPVNAKVNGRECPLCKKMKKSKLE